MLNLKPARPDLAYDLNGWRGPLDSDERDRDGNSESSAGIIADPCPQGANTLLEPLTNESSLTRRSVTANRYSTALKIRLDGSFEHCWLLRATVRARYPFRRKCFGKTNTTRRLKSRSLTGLLEPKKGLAVIQAEMVSVPLELTAGPDPPLGCAGVAAYRTYGCNY
jgi:hypothetical protein